MKRGNLRRAEAICNEINRLELRVKIASATDCKMVIHISGAGCSGHEVVIPEDHAIFLKRVIVDSYTKKIADFVKELETL